MIDVYKRQRKGRTPCRQLPKHREVHSGYWEHRNPSREPSLPEDSCTIGRHPSIKDGLGFKREAKNLASHKAPISTKEKGKAPMANSAQKNHAFIYDRKFSRNIHHDRSCNAYDSNAMFASSSSYVHSRDIPRRNVIHMPRRNVAHVPRKINEPSTIYHACNASFAICRKDKKVIARKLGAKCKIGRAHV